jgi:hypothetical protein
MDYTYLKKNDVVQLGDEYQVTDLAESGNYYWVSVCAFHVGHVITELEEFTHEVRRAFRPLSYK